MRITVVISLSCLCAASMAAEISYNRDVRPILSENCFLCHGPDEPNNKAGLRLDRPEDAFRAMKGATTGAIVPGDAAASEVWKRITSADPDEVMPPPGSHLKLSAGEIDILRRWIDAGAGYEKHWAFTELPETIPTPDVRDTTWPLDPLDTYVLARLETDDIAPSPDADPLRWLRRASFDLTGLPPSPEMIDRLRQDLAENPGNAHAEAADALLASPAYGEHMAAAWLDAARYADSYGYQSDQLNNQWPYRDWVVRAFNENLAYDEFATWQIAGDLLPDATRDQRLATSFNRLHRLTNEGGSIFEEWLAENAADRVHTFGTAFLALTMECARCHDHKYDPIPARDYFALTAFFNSIDENGLYDHPAKVPSPTMLLPTPEQDTRLAQARENLAAAENAHRESLAAAHERFTTWLANAPATAASIDLEARYTFDSIENGNIPNLAADGTGEGSTGGLPTEPDNGAHALVFDGDRGASFPENLRIDRWTPFTLGLRIRDTARSAAPVVVAQKTHGTDVGYNGFDLMLEDGHLEARLYRIWPGNGIGIRTTTPITADAWHHVAVTYDGSSTAGGLAIFLDGEKAPVEILREGMVKNIMFQGHGPGHLTLGQRFRDRGFTGGRIGELTIHTRALTPLEIGELAGNGNLTDALRAGDPELSGYYLSAIDPASRASLENLTSARKALVDAEEAIFEMPVMEELPVPRETHILDRGEYDAPTDESTRVARNTPEALPPMRPRGDVPDRLDLARWLTAPDHPLTARVFVNRLWANFFGRGLVDTPENFGLQGSLPSHPELLDRLARDFVASGWDIKALCRRIVLTRSYRQDSVHRPELADIDPENILLARGPSHRLAAEQIRDLALAASGLLEATAGGPPVSPYQPGEDLWRESNNMSPAYRQSTGKAVHRRSLYSVWKRTAPLPNMLAFDAHTRETCMVERSRTNTPLQALVLLNDVQFVEAARALAEAVHSPSVAAEIESAFLRVAARPPDPGESEILEQLHASEMRRFQADPEAAGKLISHGESKADPAIPTDHLAATTTVCLAILNLDAAIWKR